MPETTNGNSMPTELCRRLNAFAAQLDLALKDSAHEERTTVARSWTDGTSQNSYTIIYENVVTPWTEQLSAVVELSTNHSPSVRVMCAFGSVLDHTCNLEPDDHEGLKRLLDWIEDQSKAWADSAQSRDVKKTVKHPQDILSLLQIVFANADGKSAGGKSRVENEGLRRALLDGKPPFPAERRSLGGAPAIISDTLNQLGVEACFYAPYHAPEVAKFFFEKTGWLDLNSSDLSPVPAPENGRHNHPMRHGIALAYGAGKYPDFFLGGITARQSDRQLLILKQPVELHTSRPWSSWSLDGESQDMSDLATNEWPSRPAFLKWHVSESALKITPVNDDLLDRLGQRYSYVVLSAPQLGELLTRPDFLKPNNQLLHHQLRKLREAGACLHLELSGEATGYDLDTFGAFLGDTVQSVGINADELPGYARLARPGEWNPPLDDQKDEAPPPPVRYKQALALARKLQVERLYVHGNDLDIILRRNADFETMRQDATGDLFAKAVVLIATILRNPPDVTKDLILPTTLNEKTRQAMQEAIGAKVGGLEASRDHAVRMCGMVCPSPEEDGYGGSLIPCIWFAAIPRRFSATGAGDITSGVSLVYSGFRETRQGLSDVQRKA